MIKNYKNNISIIFIFLLIIILGIFISKLINSQQVDKIVLLLIIPFLISIFMLPIKSLAKLIIVLSFFWDYIFQLSNLPGRINYIFYFSLYLIFFRVLMYNKNHQIKIQFIFKIYIILLLFIAIIGLILFKPPFESFIVSIALFFAFICLYYVLISCKIDFQEQKKILQFIVIIGFLQIPASIVQKFILFPSMSFDDWGGFITYGASASNSIFLPSILVLLLSLNSIYKRNNIYILGSIILPIPLFIGQGRGGLMLYVFGGVLFFVLILFTKKKIKISVVVAIILILFSLNYLISNYQDRVGPKPYEMFTNIEEVYNYGFGIKEGKAFGRAENIQYILQILFPENPVAFIFGIGPGTFSKQGLFGAESKIFQRHKYVRSTINEVSNLLIKFGFLGTFLFLLMIIKIIAISYYVYRNSIDQFIRAVAFSFINISIIYIFGTFYKLTFSWMPLACTYWFLFYIIYDHYRELKDAKNTISQ